MNPLFCISIEEHNSFLKEYAFRSIWRWRHDNVISLVPWWQILLPHRTKLAALTTFQQKGDGKSFDPWLLGDTFIYTWKYYPAINFDLIICWRQLVMTEIIKLGKIFVWHHNDVKMTLNFSQSFGKSFISI